jgi:hypothetical protein
MKKFTISIFAVLGIVLILTAFSNQAEQKKYTNLKRLQSLNLLFKMDLDAQE